MNDSRLVLSEHLFNILKENKESSTISVENFLVQLQEKGPFALIFIVSMAFSFPISIPGLSTPFGLMLAIFGFWIGFHKKVWLPKWLLKKKMPYETFEKVVKKAIWLFSYLEKWLRPRFLFLSKSYFFVSLNGILICILSLLLSLPIPIPLTNLIAALPITMLALGMLEKDGIAILIGYLLSIISFSIFIGIAKITYSII